MKSIVVLLLKAAFAQQRSGVLFRSRRRLLERRFPGGYGLLGKRPCGNGSGRPEDTSTIAVLIPRGASLIGASRYTPLEFGKSILKTGVADYEKVLEIQEPMMARLSTHSKGELLTGLADGWNRLGDAARAWLENKPESEFLWCLLVFSCVFCG